MHLLDLQNQNSNIRNQKSNIKSWKLEVRGWKLEIRNDSNFLFILKLYIFLFFLRILLIKFLGILGNLVILIVKLRLVGTT